MPFLSDKIVSTERITLIEIDNAEVVPTEQDTANVLILQYSNVSNIITNLKIPEYDDYDPVANNINDPIFKSHCKI